MRNQAIFIAAENYENDDKEKEEEKEDCSFDIERPIPVIANIQVAIAAVGDLFSSKINDMIKTLLEVTNGL